MPRSPAPVTGVYQREDDPSGNWYARFRIDGNLVKKSFGKDRTAAIEYVEKARTLRRPGRGTRSQVRKGNTQDCTRNGGDCRNVVGAPLRTLRRSPPAYSEQAE